MTRLIVVFLGITAAAIGYAVAQQSCTTTCSSYGNIQSCTTICY